MQQSGFKNVLHLPRWYPNKSDLQNGEFVRKHIKSLTKWTNNMVLFVKSENREEKFTIEENKSENLTSVIVYFKKSGNSLLNLFRYLKGFRKGLKKLLQENGNPDLIHIHILLRNGLLGWYYSKKFKIPYVVSEHWSGYITGAFDKKNIIYRKAAIFVLKNARKILVVSPSIKTALISLGIKEEKIEIIPNVVESVENNRNGIKDDKIIILSVADLVDDIKKISEIIEVISELDKDEKIEYHIVGDGQDKEKLENIVKEKGLLNKKIFFYGRQPNSEVLKIISNCSFLIINSVTETFSVVAAEALMAGKPVIATRCGGPEYFVNNSNGILIKSGNKQELKAAVAKMIKDYKNYDPERLKNSVTERFNINKVGLQLKKVYGSIIG